MCILLAKIWNEKGLSKSCIIQNQCCGIQGMVLVQLSPPTKEKTKHKQNKTELLGNT